MKMPAHPDAGPAAGPDAKAWLALRERLRTRGLWGEGASLSLRWPGEAAFWWGGDDAAPRRIDTAHAAGEAAWHAAAYAARADVGAVLRGGGTAARALAAAGCVMPQCFDEQARHLGPMALAGDTPATLAGALRARGQWLLAGGLPMALGSTALRLALNAELAEKCATAFVLAQASGGPVQALPWWVRAIANRRLRRDGRRAAARFAQGLLPLESKGY